MDWFINLIDKFKYTSDGIKFQDKGLIFIVIVPIVIIIAVIYVAFDMTRMGILLNNVVSYKDRGIAVEVRTTRDTVDVNEGVKEIRRNNSIVSYDEFKKDLYGNTLKMAKLDGVVFYEVKEPLKNNPATRALKMDIESVRYKEDNKVNYMISLPENTVDFGNILNVDTDKLKYSVDKQPKKGYQNYPVKSNAKIKLSFDKNKDDLKVNLFVSDIISNLYVCS